MKEHMKKEEMFQISDKAFFDKKSGNNYIYDPYTEESKKIENSIDASMISEQKLMFTSNTSNSPYVTGNLVTEPFKSTHTTIRNLEDQIVKMENDLDRIKRQLKALKGSNPEKKYPRRTLKKEQS